MPAQCRHGWKSDHCPYRYDDTAPMGACGRPDPHTGCYGDVAEIPVTVLSAIGFYVTREWGENYRAGYVGMHPGAGVESTRVYVFQVKAADGSRFAVGMTRYHEPFELKGHAWLAFLQSHDIEATVRDTDLHR